VSTVGDDVAHPHPFEGVGGVSLDDARAYLELGWSPIPLPARRKYPPPGGLTGYSGRYLTAADLELHRWDGNTGLRLAPDVVAIDEDVYNGGRAGMNELREKFGPLPPTWRSTSRSDGSGIGLFRVPVGTALRTNPAEGIDVIQCFHRYVVCRPSIHPEGRPYRWLDRGGEEVDFPPGPGELPDLPWSWIDGLAAVTKAEAFDSVTPEAARVFIEALTENLCHGGLGAIMRKLAHIRKGRHDALIEHACWLARESAAGWYPAEEAFEELLAWWNTVMTTTGEDAKSDAQRRDGGEFGSAVLFGIGQALGDPERVARKRAEAMGDTDEAADGHHDGSTGGLFQWKRLPDPFVIRPIDWLARGLVMRPTHGEQAGPEKSLKSYVAALIDVALAAGIDVLGQWRVSDAVTVATLIGEGGEEMFLRRVERIARAYGVPIDDVRKRLVFTAQTAPITSRRFVDSVKQMLDAEQPALVRLDPWYAYSPRGVDARNLDEQGAALEALGGMIRDGGAVPIINNHFNQTGTGAGLRRITMAGHAEWCDSWWLLNHRQAPDVDGGRFRLRFDVGSRQWGGASYDLDLSLGRFDLALNDHVGGVTWTVRVARDDDPDAEARREAEKRSEVVTEIVEAWRRRRGADRLDPLTKTEWRARVRKNMTMFGAVFEELVDDDRIVVFSGHRGGTGKNAPRFLLAPDGGEGEA
jgi:hypothetical protein